MNYYDELELERKTAHKRFLIFVLLGVVFVLIGLGLGALITMEFIIFGLIMGVIFFIVASSVRRSFNKNFKRKIITRLIKDELGESAIYSQSSGISLSEIMLHRIYQEPDRCHEEDLIKASYNGVEYSMCDAHFEERHVTHDSKGHRRVSYVTYFKGRIISISLNRDLDARLKIIEGHPRGFVKYSLEKFETELIDFNKKYDTYVNDKEKAFYILTPVMLQKLLELEKLFKGSIQYSFEQNSLMIFINNSGDSLECSMSKKINEENLNIIRSQINLAAAIINEFNLDADKYQKEINI